MAEGGTDTDIGGLLQPSQGVELDPDRIDSLLSEAESAEDPSPALHTVLAAYEEADKLTPQDAIRLQEMRRFAEINGQYNAAERIDEIDEKYFKTTVDINVRKPFRDLRQGEYREALREVSHIGRGILRAGRIALGLIAASEELRRNGYDGWTSSTDEDTGYR